jgi:protein-S-isoprenylcysteine O-methyltransferase Ste14
MKKEMGSAQRPSHYPGRFDRPGPQVWRRFWGAGPRIVTATLVFAVVVTGFSNAHPALKIGAHRPAAAHLAGWALLLVALVVWFVVIGLVRAAYEEGRLITDGLFAYVRHPIYAEFIFLVCPGIALLAWSWPMLALPVFAYGMYVLFIRDEEARLVAEFGEAYEIYRERVPALVPRFRS